MKMHSSSRSRQRGVALIISLIFLVLLTLIAVSAMQGTILQERMAGNTRNRMLAFQAAEAALKAGEASIGGGSLPSGTGYYMTTGSLPSTNFTSSQDWTTFNWGSSTAVTYNNGTLNGVAQPPQYVVERLTLTKPAGCSGGSVTNITFGPSAGDGYFRITARGVGGTTNAAVILQEIYMRCN